ncbi:hypothetical protein V8E36_000986 [Tilletia maclaganii]
MSASPDASGSSRRLEDSPAPSPSVEDVNGRIIVLDPFAAPDDVKSKQRLQTLVELIIDSDGDVAHQTAQDDQSSLFTELEKPIPSASTSNGASADDDDDDAFDDFQSAFQVNVHPPTSAPTKMGTFHSTSPWHISNRYYDADAHFATISLPLGSPRSSITAPVAAVLKAYEQVQTNVPAVILLVSDAYDTERHKAVLDQVESVRDAFNIEVALAINLAEPLSPETPTSSSRRVAHSAAEESLEEIYTERGWEYIDLSASAEGESDEDEAHLDSVAAGEAETTGIARVREALYANSWPNFVRNDDRRRGPGLLSSIADPAEEVGLDTSAAPPRSFLGFSDAGTAQSSTAVEDSGTSEADDVLAHQSRTGEQAGPDDLGLDYEALEADLHSTETTAEIAALSAGFSSMAFPDSIRARADESDDAAGSGFEQVMSNMAALRAQINSHQSRIAAIEDPQQKRVEAAKFSLAFTQFLMGELDEDDLAILAIHSRASWSCGLV